MVSSRGRPIGVTDLGFCRVHSWFRSGWFYPNSYGEQVMPVIAAVLPAMRAYLHRDVLGEDGKPVVQPHLIGSPFFADIKEALERVAALDLRLHHADGTLVPTENVGIQDTEQLLALADLNPLSDDDEGWSPEDEEEWSPDDIEGWTPDEGLDDDFDAAWLDTNADTILEGGLFDDVRAWAPNEEPTTFPRYQIHVMLAGGPWIGPR
jgi:hypothetical protein